jgi:hypothetical protein
MRNGTPPPPTAKMVFRGNELKKLFEMNGLAFCNAENELIFEHKRTQFGPPKRQKWPFLCLRTRHGHAPDATGHALPEARENVNRPPTCDREFTATRIRVLKTAWRAVAPDPMAAASQRQSKAVFIQKRRNKPGMLMKTKNNVKMSRSADRRFCGPRFFPCHPHEIGGLRYENVGTNREC